jgi:hypothetical protein
MGRLLHKESLMSVPGLGFARTRTRSTKWGGTPMQTTMVESGNSEINKIPPHNVRVQEF